MYDLMILFFEIIGTVAFAASGAFTGQKKQMDLLGICVLGCVTAVGGGIIRDLLLGLTPPKTFEHPIYIIIAIITSLVCCLPMVTKTLREKSILDSQIMRLMDSIGLGVFTVLGIQTAQEYSTGHNLFLLVLVGVLTGVGGGVVRDVLAGERPYIFIKHFYATASLIGAILCALLWDHIDIPVNIIISALVVIVLRQLAAKFRWKLPTPQ